MNLPVKKSSPYPEIVEVRIDADRVTASLGDGRIASVAIEGYPRLAGATKAERENFEISPGGYGIHWPLIDEDISVKAFLG